MTNRPNVGQICDLVARASGLDSSVQRSVDILARTVIEIIRQWKPI